MPAKQVVRKHMVMCRRCASLSSQPTNHTWSDVTYHDIPQLLHNIPCLLVSHHPEERDAVYKSLIERAYCIHV